jgi:hypothetical protein
MTTDIKPINYTVKMMGQAIYTFDNPFKMTDEQLKAITFEVVPTPVKDPRGRKKKNIDTSSPPKTKSKPATQEYVIAFKKQTKHDEEDEEDQ